jgi:Domain of unknown function (DUF4158)
MKILNAVEQEAFESPPVFNSVQRKQHFDFPLALHHLASSLHTPTHQLCFLLSSAYFKATKRFFAPEDFRPRDIEYVAAQLNFSEKNFDSPITATGRDSDTNR